jgi:hypothetical protein
MGNRVQHALRAYTPHEQKAVSVAASTFRPNPKFKTEDIITQLGKGEALVSVLDQKGVPSIVQRTLIRPPSSRLGPITAEERRKVVKNSPLYGQYEQTEDRESAYEKLLKKASARATEQKQVAEDKAQAKAERAAPRARESATDRFIKNAASSVGRQLGNALIRGILGGLMRR